MDRRDFLISAAAVAGLSTAGRTVGRGWAQGAQQSKLDRMAIMGWSFNSIIRRPGDENDPTKTLEIMDLPQMFADRYGVHNIEMQQVHFMSTEPSYFLAFKEKVAQARSRITQINLEFQASLSAPEHFRRLEAVDLTRHWIDYAVLVGSPRVMVNQGTLLPENRPAAVEALKLMRDYGNSKNVRVTIENRGANWPQTAEVIRASGVHSNPDLGAPSQEEQIAMIHAMYPMHAGSVHVKLNPARYDLPTALRLLREKGYDGLYSVEAGGSGDPHANVQAIMDVTLANI